MGNFKLATPDVTWFPFNWAANNITWQNQTGAGGFEPELPNCSLKSDARRLSFAQEPAPERKAVSVGTPSSVPGFVPFHAMSFCFMPPLKHSWMGALVCLPVANHLLILMIWVLYLHNITREQCAFGCRFWPEPNWCLHTKDLLAIHKAPWREVASAPLVVKKSLVQKSTFGYHSLTPREEGTSGQGDEVSLRSQTDCTHLHICLSACTMHCKPTSLPKDQGFQEKQWIKGGSKRN